MTVPDQCHDGVSGCFRGPGCRADVPLLRPMVSGFTAAVAVAPLLAEPRTVWSCRAVVVDRHLDAFAVPSADRRRGRAVVSAAAAFDALGEEASHGSCPSSHFGAGASARPACRVDRSLQESERVHFGRETGKSMTMHGESSVPPDPMGQRAGRCRRLRFVALGWGVGCLLLLMPIWLHREYLVQGPATHTVQWTFSSFVTGWFAGERLNFRYWGSHRPYHFPVYDAWFWGSLAWEVGIASLYVLRPRTWTKRLFIGELMLRSLAATFILFVYSLAGV